MKFQICSLAHVDVIYYLSGN